MKVKNINQSIKNNKLVLSGQLVLNSGKVHDVYFEVDKRFKEYVSQDIGPFLAAALGVSMRLGEDLEIESEISQHLLTNVPKITKIIAGWGDEFKQIRLTTQATHPDLPKAKNVGCFFSGGVDSFYTYLKHKNKISHYIFVHGFDIKAKDVELFNKIEKNIAQIAKEEKVELIEVKTNLREIFDQYFVWDVSHEFAIAAVALFLRNGFNQIYLSCGLPEVNGEHSYLDPEIDYLWSTENMKLIHYGCDADKIGKLKFLSNNKLVMDNLRVCWVNKNQEYNCCECEKCLRNMLALYASDTLDKCKSFSKSLNLDKLRRIRVDEYGVKYFTAILKALVIQKDESEVRYALEECIKFNTQPNFHQRLEMGIRDSVRYFDNKYNSNRLFWYLSAKGLI